MRRLSPLVFVAALAVAPGARGFEIYHSPADDGTNPGVPASVPIGGSLVLNLYLGHGTGIPSAAGEECSGVGTGEEMCMADLHVVADPNLTILSFTPDPGFGAISNVTGSEARFNGGDPFSGDLLFVRVGQMEISAVGPGNLSVPGEAWVDSLLNANDASQVQPLASACDDGDGDTLCDADDPCAAFANVDFTDANGDGIPNECQCADTNGDGFVTSTDAFNMVNCLVDPACPAGPVDPDIWDTNNDGFVVSTDAFNAVNAAFVTMTPYTLTCARRPEGTPAP